MDLSKDPFLSATRDLIQHMVDKYMTGSDAFRNAIIIYDLRVCQRWSTPTLDGRVYHVAVYDKTTPDGDRYEFPTEAAASEFVAGKLAYSSQPVVVDGAPEEQA